MDHSLVTIGLFFVAFVELPHLCLCVMTTFPIGGLLTFPFGRPPCPLSFCVLCIFGGPHASFLAFRSFFFVPLFDPRLMATASFVTFRCFSGSRSILYYDVLHCSESPALTVLSFFVLSSAGLHLLPSNCNFSFFSS